MEGKHSIYKRLAAVLAEVGSVPKNGHNDYDNYSYVMAGDLVDHLRPLLSKNGLAILVEFSDFVDLEEGRVKVIGAVHVGDVDGNEVILPIVGEAKDVSKDGRRKDKAVFKAMTGAYKRWLEKTFMVATEEDEPERPGEAEKHIAPPPQPPAKAPIRPVAPPTPAPAPADQPGPSCPSHGPMRFNPAGVSKRTGKAYGAFWSCKERGCETKTVQAGDWERQQTTQSVQSELPGTHPASDDQINIIRSYSTDPKMPENTRIWLAKKLLEDISSDDAKTIIGAVRKHTEVTAEEIPF